MGRAEVRKAKSMARYHVVRMSERIWTMKSGAVNGVKLCGLAG